MKKAIYLMWSILGITMLTAGYFLYLILQPFQAPTLTEPIPILNKDHIIHHGEHISTKIEYCVFQGVPSTTSKRYEQVEGDRRVYFFQTSEGSGKDKDGKQIKNLCGTVESNTASLPGDIPPGKYKIVLTTTYRVNALKSVTVKYETEEFFIAK